MSETTMKEITREQITDRSTCPACGSKDIKLVDSGCLCNTPGHSCWQHPVCKSCGFTAGPAAGNSEGGIWVAFSKLGKSGTYLVRVREALKWTMSCYFCGDEVPSNGVDMPEGWGMRETYGTCADGKPGMEPMYACPDCKEIDV